MNQLHPDTQEPYFEKISQYNANRLNFYVKKGQEEDAIAVIEEFISYCKNTLPAASRKQLLIPYRNPVIIGAEETPQQLVSFFKAASKRPSSSISVTASTSTDISPLSTPPLTNRQRYSDALKKRALNPQTLTSPNPTAPTATSTVSTATDISAINARIDSILADSKSQLEATAAEQRKLTKELESLGNNLLCLADQFKKQHQQYAETTKKHDQYFTIYAETTKKHDQYFSKHDQYFSILFKHLNVDLSSHTTSSPTSLNTQEPPDFTYPDTAMPTEDISIAPDPVAGQQ